MGEGVIAVVEAEEAARIVGEGAIAVVEAEAWLVGTEREVAGRRRKRLL